MAESKDPYREDALENRARKSLSRKQNVSRRTERKECERGNLPPIGVLRLREGFASRSLHSTQDDKRIYFPLARAAFTLASRSCESG